MKLEVSACAYTKCHIYIYKVIYGNGVCKSVSTSAHMLLAEIVSTTIVTT